MPDALFAPVFTAQPQALTAALDRAAIRPDMAEPKKGRVVALVHSVLPDVLETPTRVKRLNNAVVDWLTTSPRTWSELEAIRQEFHDIFTDYVENVTRVLEAARELGFPPDTITALERSKQELDELQTTILATWQPFTRADHEAALDEIRQGKTHDLDEVIRELQGRGH